MIELAPQHKEGLPVANPILLAGGTIGYGEALPRGLNPDKLGAVVVGPIMRASRAGTAPPRVAETNGGFVLETGQQNRGLTSALRRFAKLWPMMGCPVIVQVAEDTPRGLAQLVERLSDVRGVRGLEILAPNHGDFGLALALVRQAARYAEVPLWVKLPLEDALTWAPAIVEAGANALVVGQPPIGTILRSRHRVAVGSERQPQGETAVTGGIYGPLTFAPMLKTLMGIIGLDLSCAVIACGGIHTLAQVHQALSVGAQAVQIDSAVWVEPSLPELLAKKLAREQG